MTNKKNIPPFPLEVGTLTYEDVEKVADRLGIEIDIKNLDNIKGGVLKIWREDVLKDIDINGKYKRRAIKKYLRGLN